MPFTIFEIMKNKLKQVIPERFQVSRSTLWMDRFMTGLIISGGMLVIAAVLGIFVFIFAETLPLFYSASVDEEKSELVLGQEKKWLTLDKHGERLFVYDSGKLNLVDKSGQVAQSWSVTLDEGDELSTLAYNAAGKQFVLGTRDAKVAFFSMNTDAGSALPEYEFFELSGEENKGSVVELSFSDAGEVKVFAALQEKEGKKSVQVLMLEASRSLIDEGGLTPKEVMDVTPLIEGEPKHLLTTLSGSGLIIVSEDNDIYYLEYDDEEEVWQNRQVIRHPFGDQEKVNVVEWVQGEVSLVLGGDQGSLEIWSLYPQVDAEGNRRRIFGKTKEFPALSSAVLGYSASQKNRSFFVSSEKSLRLCYATTADVRWEDESLPYVASELCGNGELTQLWVKDAEGKSHFYEVTDLFPEAGMDALFSKVWYEGYDEPAWQWQSVGGTDDYEPKLSLIPLIFGTLKGTFYALLFAVPIALLSAVYTSHFMDVKVKRVVKPMMEIMASLPSVVLGFFGALYLAPRMEDKVPALICMGVLIPLTALLLGYFWMTRSIELRNKIKGGFEYWVMIPVIGVIAWFCWSYLGEWLEYPFVRTMAWLFGLDGEGKVLASFPDLWRDGFGMAYEQRNSLVVGFIMGFAVIPIIFTISEDALSNVPVSLLSGAEALGASRWQIVKTVVLPVAAAGIFSALMIGLGRAVGETMIVLMATGNTPIMDVNIFNGMRTLSANIATELPEAAQHSTHYRILFLGALILFMMTFVINTIAEFMRYRLREKYKVV